MLHPSRFGFHPYRGGWIKQSDSAAPLVIAPLSWPHAQAPSFAQVDSERHPMDALNFLVQLQEQTWGMPPEEVVPANLLAVLADTGGSLLVAYHPDAGFNADGWLGFAIALGAHKEALVSHMLGVREDARATQDIGWYLKVIQGYEALRAGHTAAIWTFDPMRGVNARLNLEKLGAQAVELTINKYGALRSALYGHVPTDRLTARWNLLDPATWSRIGAVAGGTYASPRLTEIADIPLATPESIDDLRRRRPQRLRYRIPGDIDRLMRTDPATAIGWRHEMRDVLSALLRTKSARIDAGAERDPLAVEVDDHRGEYLINGFVTETDELGERASYYLLARLPGLSREDQL
jgi:predicted GNAT superfamily acetyltransferase